MYNSEKTIEKSIRSALSQNPRPTKIVVVDDCSSDNSLNILLKLKKSTEVKIVICENIVNSGPGHSRNEGMKYVSTELVAFLDADDVWHDDKIKKCLPYFERDKELAILSHAYIKKIPFIRYALPLTLARTLFGPYSFFNTPCVIIRNKHFLKFQKRSYGEDANLWFRILSKEKGIFINDVLSLAANERVDNRGLSSNLTKMYVEGQLYNLKELRDTGQINYCLNLYCRFLFFIKYKIRIFKNK